MRRDVDRNRRMLGIGMAHIGQILPQRLVQSAVDTDVFIGRLSESRLLIIIVIGKISLDYFLSKILNFAFIINCTSVYLPMTKISET